MEHIRFKRIIQIGSKLGHTCLVLFFVLFPLALFYQTKNKIQAYDSPLLSPFYWLFVISFVGFFYGFTYYFIPKYFLKKQYGKFWSIFLLIFLLFYFIKPAELFFAFVLLPLKSMKAPVFNPFALDFIGFLIFLMLTALGFAIQIVKQWRESERRAFQAETDKKNAELSFLKAQINPHFLFNTLNTIYTLILTNNPLAGNAVLKLSNIMRYVTDDATADFVSLEKEVASITDFIELQQLQHNKKVKIAFSVSGDPANKKIAPLLLLTYIENAFKFGASNHEIAPITILLDIEEDSIKFFCRNKIFSKPRMVERTGIGLLNTQKRLEFLYPDKHTLSITSKDDLYSVSLTLPA